MIRTIFAVLAIAVTACEAKTPTTNAGADDIASERAADYNANAYFAGGCFWCVEADLEKLDGVGDVVSGYSGGESDAPTYRDHAGHKEAVRAPYDPDVISYRALVDYFLRHIDPLDDGGQFCDRGESYRTAIFVQNAEEREAAEAAIAEGEAQVGEPFATPVLDYDAFYVAEDYHQDYYEKNPVRYGFYRRGCGRDSRVEAVWGE